ncbi:hypothetical protein HYDPIDRAFT_93577 [Hydnomerulius pinastri MD-312]|uniref:Enoyl reductase (ER) domain-containing protein n=1 Tax=Hydnomerulius pinastri MD-312 TaxID=994086 RepID=A0A0C9VX30_9AGAM|nr:hypothetical protein HYDPIDRAFT_93577 [Hydnomerulius pinastri MD-312]
MRAVVCPRAPIAPSELVYTKNHPTPSPKPGHVLIRVRAYGLNRSELFTRQGHSPGIKFPRVLGIECVGEVKDAGGGKWKEGDVVAAIVGGMGRQYDGGYAEFTLVPHTSVSPPIKLPQTMNWAQFAAIPETYLTAWGTLHDSLKLKKEDTLFIRGGTTSVGLAAASLAKSALFNCEHVISTTRSSSKSSIVRDCGADDVLVDSSGSVAEEVKKLTGEKKGADKCVELVGGPTLMDSCKALSLDGVISMIGCVSGEWTCKEFDPMASLAPRKHLTMFSSHTLDISTAPLQYIVDAVAKGEMKAGIDKVFKMEDTGEAHAYMEANKAAGKVVCVID